MVRRSKSRSPLARAAFPVLGGLAFFALLGLALWGVAALISGNSDQASGNLANRTFQPGSVIRYASIVKQDGPLIFPALIGTSGDRTIVLDHPPESDPKFDWRIYLAYPADRGVSCKVVQVRTTRNFTDCDGRTLSVDRLALPPEGVFTVVSADGILTLNLIPRG